MSKLIKSSLRNILVTNVLGLAILGLVVIIMTLAGHTFTTEHAESFLFWPLGSVIGTVLGAVLVWRLDR